MFSSLPCGKILPTGHIVPYAFIVWLNESNNSIWMLKGYAFIGFSVQCSGKRKGDYMRPELKNLISAKMRHKPKRFWQRNLAWTLNTEHWNLNTAKFQRYLARPIRADHVDGLRIFQTLNINFEQPPFFCSLRPHPALHMWSPCPHRPWRTQGPHRTARISKFDRIGD